MSTANIGEAIVLSNVRTLLKKDICKVCHDKVTHPSRGAKKTKITFDDTVPEESEDDQIDRMKKQLLDLMNNKEETEDMVKTITMMDMIGNMSEAEAKAICTKNNKNEVK